MLARNIRLFSGDLNPIFLRFSVGVRTPYPPLDPHMVCGSYVYDLDQSVLVMNKWLVE